MKKLVASTPNAEVSGQSVLGYLNCLQIDEIAPILQKYGLEDTSPDKWYPHQTMLNVLGDIESNTYNVSDSLVSIGMKVMEMVPLPPAVNGIEALLGSLADVYHLHHRNVTEKGWETTTTGPRHMHVSHYGPYPEDLCYGIVWGSLKRFKPQGAFKITPIQPENPDEPVIYDVTWED